MLNSSFSWTPGMRGTFSWADYLVFGGMLAASLAIGIYYAIKSRYKANEEFLLGSRSLTCFPVSMSLLASYISAILVLGQWSPQQATNTVPLLSPPLFLCLVIYLQHGLSY